LNTKSRGISMHADPLESRPALIKLSI
jgi:hypothetical protein